MTDMQSNESRVKDLASSLNSRKYTFGAVDASDPFDDSHTGVAFSHKTSS